MRRLKPFAAIWPVRPEDCQRASSVTERLTGRALGASREGAHGSGWGPAGGEQELRRHRDGVDEWEGSGRAEGHAAAAAAADGCRRGAPRREGVTRGSPHLHTVLYGIEVLVEVSRSRGDPSEVGTEYSCKFIVNYVWCVFIMNDYWNRRSPVALTHYPLNAPQRLSKI
jgi:hypothetical protein